MSTKREELNFHVTNAAKCLNLKAALNIIPKSTLENTSSGKMIKHRKKDHVNVKIKTDCVGKKRAPQGNLVIRVSNGSDAVQI